MSDPVRDIRVAVCIPTYDRPEGLRRALTALASQDIGEPILVVVANNRPGDQRVAEVVEACRCSLDIHLIDVTIRGVSAVRNAAVAAALALCPALEWLAFQDDDEIAAPGWLAVLREAGRQWNADLVGGAVTVRDESGALVAGYGDNYRKPEDGPVAQLAGTNNLMIRATFLRQLGREPFRPDYGASGGEDYEFFRFSRALAARMVWTNGALIEEVWPADRIRLPALMRRERRKGMYMVRADIEYDGQLAAAWATLRAGLSLIRVRGSSLGQIRAVVLMKLWCVAGRVAGHVGFRSGGYAA